MNGKYKHDTAHLGEKTRRVMLAVHSATCSTRHPRHTGVANEEVTKSQRMIGRALMKALHHTGTLSVQDLAKHMGLSTTSVSAITDRLEAKGVVVLERQPDDPCAALVRISPTHEQDRRARWISREQKIDMFVQNLSEEEVETFCTVLDKYSAFMHEGS